MIAFIKRHAQTIILCLILLAGAFLRFYNLKWDEGWFFHPDERNIAIAVTNLDFENGDYNPNFFAYGTLPIYLIRIFSGARFENAILTGRLISAVISTINIFLIFVLSKYLIKEIVNKKYTGRIASYSPLIAALLMAFNPGMIQFAHFTTFETFLTFEYLLLTIALFKLADHGKTINYVVVGSLLGISVATKIVSLALIPLLLAAHFIFVFNKYRSEKFWRKTLWFILGHRFWLAILLLLVCGFVFSPYNILDYEAFRSSLNYEGPVARGTLPVFYTQQFIQTIPFIYQFFRVFPYILGWPLTIIGFLATLLFFIKSAAIFLKTLFKSQRFKYKYTLLFILVAVLYGSFHFSMFVKWTRYMIPLVPFLICLSLMFFNLFNQPKLKLQKLTRILLIVTVIFSVLQGINFFSIYLKPDPRVEAAKWAGQNVPKGSFIVSEIYDMGIVPWNDQVGSSNIKLIPFYELGTEENFYTAEMWQDVERAEYVVVLSNRIYPTRFRLQDKYPITAKFYRQLFDGSLGFERVATFKRQTAVETLLDDDQIPQQDGNLFFSVDESFEVFDQPTIMVFKRVDKSQ